MTSSRWQRVEEVYHAALEQPPDARDAFLERACAGDQELLREVRSLLQYEAEIGGFMEEPAAEAATVAAPPEPVANEAPVRDSERARRPPGVPLFSWGDLEVLERIGEGGFGEVYRAWDTRLEREVALKLLLPKRAGLADNRASVVREGRILARIKNPHVVTVHGADDRDGRVGIWMELLRGKSLKKLVETQGPLGEREAMIVAIDLCRALSAVHREGIVHGDVKAENVIREQGGRIVLMDFGIGVDLGADAPRRRGGTPGYMAPELLAGVAPSARSDLYALGVLLHFAVSASLPSGGGDTDVVVAGASGGERSLRDERPGLSQGFLRVVERALAPEPEQRYGSTGEMERELAVALASSGSIPVVRKSETPAPSPRGRQLWAAAVGAAALALAATVYFGSEGTGAGAPADVAGATRGEPGEPAARPITSYPGAELQPALSPQGDRVAFQWRDAAQNDDIWGKLVGEEPPLRLTDDPASECCPSWSPDGQRIAFIRASGPEPGIYLVPSLGGRERRLTSSVAWFGSASSWTPDGAALVYSAAADPGQPRRLWRLSLDTLESEPVTSPPRGALGDAFPSVSPDGRRIAFSRVEAGGDLLTTADVFVAPAAGGPARRLTELGRFIGGLDWAPDGRRIVFSTRNGQAIELRSVTEEDRQTRLVRTPWPSAIDHLSESASAPSRAYRLSYARTRPRLSFASSSFDLNIWRFSLPELGVRESLIASTFSDTGPSFSPDGRQIAFESRRSGAAEVWACSSSGDDCAALTAFGDHTGSPSWSPRGGLVAFDARPRGNADIYLVDVATRRQRPLTTDEAEDVVPSWSNDGDRVYFSSDRSGRWEIWSTSKAGEGPIQITRQGGFSAAESPDGRWLLHARLDEPGLWRAPVEGGPSQRVTGDVSCWGYWAVGTRGVYLVKTALERPLLELLPWDAETPLHLGELLELPACGNRGLAVSPDERWLLLARTDLAEGDLLMVDEPR